MRRAFYALTGSEALAFGAFALVAAIAAVWGLLDLQSRVSTIVPARGGEIIEGAIGVPRLINPLLAASDADRDMVALVYSGLVRIDASGEVIPDLAESYEVSQDGLEYRFKLRDTTFHDGTPVSSADVAFTIERAISPSLKSPKRAAWEGITVETPDPRTVIFKLAQPYPRFIENATLGILPKRLWGGLADEAVPHSILNAEPIGTGPFKVRELVRTDAGIPASYILDAFENFALGEPFIRSIDLRYYPDTESLAIALDAGEIDAAHGLATHALTELSREDLSTLTASLPRLFGAFYNQSKNASLTDVRVRHALDLAIDREAITTDIFNGFADVRTAPFMIDSVHTFDLEAAGEQLDAAGWNLIDGIRRKGEDASAQALELELTTPDAGELPRVADALAEQWRRLGIVVEVRVVDQASISAVIRPREFQVLLFGQAVGWNPDLYAFWHSSQRLDPGLNVAGYVNSTADKALVGARAARDKDGLLGYHESFLKEFEADAPAAFLFSPRFAYVLSREIKGAELGRITTPSDRFSMVHTWYIATDSVWNAFVRD
jgi:peptide/nickel transport system substrate-binding protein